MGSPFTTTSTLAADVQVTPATDAQITRAIVPAIERGAWKSAEQIENAPKHVSRVAALNLVIRWALNPMDDATPPAISRVINGTVGRNSSYGERVNAILAHLRAEGTAAEGQEFVYADLTKAGASKLIEWLFSLDTAPAAPTAAETEVEVPAGRYAVEISNSTVGNDLAFYKVDRPTEGKWAGRVFVNQIVGPDEQPVRGKAAQTVLAQIAADPAAASIRYGKSVEKCGVCHTRLTNKVSREAGIGPDCRKKYGW